MNIYVYSDTHFGHDNMVVWALRPVDFNEKIWKMLDQIPKDSLFIHCGDFSMGSDALSHMRFQQYLFKKMLVRGNHDNHSISWYLKSGWDMVVDEAVIKMFGGTFLFSHYPLPKREGITKNIHGHLHGSRSHPKPDFYDEDYHVEVTPEVVGYNLVKLSSNI